MSMDNTIIITIRRKNKEREREGDDGMDTLVGLMYIHTIAN